jgi:hypothetical protein
LAEKGDITMPQLAAELAARGTKILLAIIARWFIRQGYSLKKRCGLASKDAPTCAKPASTGAPSASRACAASARLSR